LTERKEKRVRERRGERVGFMFTSSFKISKSGIRYVAKRRAIYTCGITDSPLLNTQEGRREREREIRGRRR
jgi:hypothetical protein